MLLPAFYLLQQDYYFLLSLISPSAEVYFLDTAGKVIAFHPNEKEVRLWQLPLKNINRLIASNGQDYITGPDPRDPSNPKIFSAAKVKGKSKDLGYIYVILGSNKNVTNMLYTSYFGNLLVKVFFVIIVLSIIFSLVYLNRIQKSFNRMISVLERFQDGDLEARFNIKENEELATVTTAFNKMADLLVYNIDRLTKSEKERKDFIANISHDLRTPLSIARGYTETLLMKNEKQVITFKDLTVDGVKRKASIQGERLDLTSKEFDLLLLLASNPGKTFSRNELLEMIWGVAFLGYEHTITSHINRLRIKIETNLHTPEYILTSWGTGYRFSE